jgi:YXWGXW repeat-containing protein
MEAKGSKRTSKEVLPDGRGRNFMKITNLKTAIQSRTVMRGCGFRAIVILAGVIALATGCAERRVEPYRNQQTGYSTNGQFEASAATNAPSGAVEAPLTPPADLVEAVPVAPGPAYVWVPGYWVWNGGWVWIGGRWVIRPYPHAVWVRGHWGRHGRGYAWTRGHWR